MLGTLKLACTYTQEIFGLSTEEYEVLTGFNVRTQKHCSTCNIKKALALYEIALSLDADEESVTQELLHTPLKNNKTIFSLMQQELSPTYKATIVFACKNITVLIQEY